MMQISVEIIHKCPNHCLHCSSLSSPSCKDIIPKDTVFEIIDGAKALGTEIFCISGGEPFLHEDLASIVKYAKKQGLRVYIYTSGIYMDKCGQVSSLPQSVLYELKKAEVDRVIFDLPAVNESIYDKFMGTSGHLRYALDSIDLTKAYGVFTEIHFVPTKINIDEIDNVLSYSKAKGLDRVSFLGLVPHGRAKNNAFQLYLSAKETVALKEKLHLIQSEKVRIGIPLQINNEEYQCYAGCGKLCIRYDGRVFGCEAFKYIQLFDDEHHIIEPDSIYNRRIEQIYNDSDYLKAEKKFIIKSMSAKGCPEKCPVQRMFRRIV